MQHLRPLIISALCVLMFSCFSFRGGDTGLWLPNKAVWAKNHLTVHMGPAFKGHERSLKYAMDDFPCDLFVLHDGTSNPDVQIIMNTEDTPKVCGKWDRPDNTEEEGGTGWAGLAYRCDDESAEIRMNPLHWQGSNITRTYLLFLHELGHVAGLAHDAYYSENSIGISVMTPNVLKWSVRLGQGKQLPQISRGDYAALEKRYCDE